MPYQTGYGANTRYTKTTSISDYMTITTVLVFLPFLTCLFWLVLTPLLSSRDVNAVHLELLLFMTGVSMLSYAAMNNEPISTATIVFFLVGQFATISVFPLAFSYLNHLENKNKKYYSILFLSFSIPISLLFVETALFMLSGKEAFMSYLSDFREGVSNSDSTDKIEQITYFCSVWIYNSILVAGTLILLMKTFIKSKFKRHIQLMNISFLVMAYFLMTMANFCCGGDKTWISILFPIIMSSIIFLIAYTGLFHNYDELVYRDLWKGTATITKYGDILDNQPSLTVDNDDNQISPMIPQLHPDNDSHSIENNPRIKSLNTAYAHLDQIDEDSLRIRFEDLIITEQLFLRQGIRISEIASMLDTNRTYVSRLVNNTYNMSFSDYINTLRIDYAEQYLLHNKNAKQSDIAAACGFPNASSFNNIFKKITGVTPKIWLAKNTKT